MMALSSTAAVCRVGTCTTQSTSTSDFRYESRNEAAIDLRYDWPGPFRPNQD